LTSKRTNARACSKFGGGKINFPLVKDSLEGRATKVPWGEILVEGIEPGRNSYNLLSKGGNAGGGGWAKLYAYGRGSRKADTKTGMRVSPGLLKYRGRGKGRSQTTNQVFTTKRLYAKSKMRDQR